VSGSNERRRVRAEFARAASGFADRTKGRFDDMDVLGFCELTGVPPEGRIVGEVGAGTGNFLALFEGVASDLVAIDLTPEMLVEARKRAPGMYLVVGDGARLPFRSGSIDLFTCAQMLHHVHEPVPLLREMGRVASPEGHVLIVDQIASERFEEAVRMNELELIRDPSHAASRPPSAFRIMTEAAGLEIVREKRWEGEQRLSRWMWPGEFPDDRIRAVRDFINAKGHQTGMGFERDGDDYRFVRRRTMVLARRAG
jgi:SAM-dependent methyltransferase